MDQNRLIASGGCGPLERGASKAHITSLRLALPGLLSLLPADAARPAAGKMDGADWWHLRDAQPAGDRAHRSDRELMQRVEEPDLQGSWGLRKRKRSVKRLVNRRGHLHPGHRRQRDVDTASTHTHPQNACKRKRTH